MRRFIFLGLLLTLLLPSSFALAGSDESSKSSVTQELATSCDPATYKCLCDSKPSALVLKAPLDASACQNDCANTYSGTTTYSVTCTNKATPSTTITNVSGPVTPVIATADPKPSPVIPNLIVDIGAVFSPPTQNGAYTQTTFLAVYVNAIYKLLMISCSVLAITMIMVAGLQYTLARGNPKGITKAKERIKNAVVGLVLLMCAYTLAYLLDPNTTSFATLKIESVPNIELAEPSEDAENMDPSLASAADYTGPVESIPNTHNLVAGKSLETSSELLTKLEGASDALFAATTHGIAVADANRSVNSQATLFYDRCLAGDCDPAACDPTGSTFGVSSVIDWHKGKPYTLKGVLAGLAINPTNRSTFIAALIADGKPSKCNHTNHQAVDIWPAAPGRHTSYCAGVKEMTDMTKIMTDPAYGFCRLTIEAWHFEYHNGASTSSCLTSYKDSTTNRDAPTSKCDIWNYGRHCCNVAVDPTDTPSNMCSPKGCGL